MECCSSSGRQVSYSECTQNSCRRSRRLSACRTIRAFELQLQQRHVAGVRASKPLRHVCATALPPSIVQKPPPKRLCVFVSGGGSNFRAIHQACVDGRINGEIAVVVSDIASCGGVEYAASHDIPTLLYPRGKQGGAAALSTPQLIDALKSTFCVDYVLLAGYLKLIPQEVVAAYHRAMLNIHPGLLPAFGGKGYYGERVHAAVIKSGARFSGPTIHFVDEEFDTGPILAQRVVPVLPFDTPKSLAARVLVEEHKLYPEVVAAICDDRVTFREDGVPIIWHAK